MMHGQKNIKIFERFLTRSGRVKKKPNAG